MVPRTDNVTRFNLDKIQGYIKQILPFCSYVGLDAEFPGDPVEYDNKWMIPGRSQEAFEIMKANCDATNPIAIGLSFWDAQHRLLYNANFNLFFDTDTELVKEGSIEYLENRGMDLSLNKLKGIGHQEFKDFLWKTKLLKNPNLFWVTFQGSRDLAYLLRLATNEYYKIQNVEQFNFLVRKLFLNYIDLKHLVTSCNYFSLLSKRGLKQICNEHNVHVINTNCPASDDAYTTVGLYVHILTKLQHINLGLYANTLWNMRSGLERIPQNKKRKLYRKIRSYVRANSGKLQQNPPDIYDKYEFPSLG